VSVSPRKSSGSPAADAAGESENARHAPRRDSLREISIESLLDNSTSDFDLWLDVSGRLVLFAPAPYQWTRAELTRLLAEGHRKLFYSTEDQSKVEAFVRIAAIPRVDPGLPPAGRILGLTDAAAELTRVLYEHPLSGSALKKGKEIASGMVTTITEDPASIAALGKLAHHDYYTYYHSARVAAYALAIALHMSERAKEHLEAIALGCIFHDVGKSRIDLALLNKQGPLTPEEWTVMRQHPLFGAESVQGSVLEMVPLEIITHHHEKLDGAGYPHNLSGQELLPEVRIAAFADIFDALTTNRPYQVSRTRFEALDLIKNRMLGFLDRDVYKAMIEILKLADSGGKS